MTSKASSALVFPGQGSQFVGMGRDLAENFAEARAVFEEISDALSFDLTRIMFEGPDGDLNLTENTQPALMAVSMAVMRVLEGQGGFRLQDRVSYVAGHSLGEYSALTAAGALTLSDTARLLKLRGQSMQKAVPVGKGAMAAILGLDFEAVDAIATESAAAGSDALVCEAANDNAPGQVVISGHVQAVEKAVALASERGAKRAILLPVSAPFHCQLMQPAAEAMHAALDAVVMKAPLVPVVANVTARAETDPAAIKSLLVEQVTGRVRWRETIAYLAEKGVVNLAEIGAGKVLSGLGKRIHPDVKAISVGTPADIDAFLKAE